MKKSILLVAAALAFAFTAEAQTNKQVAGSKSMEVQFAPLGGNPISIDGIKFRSFSTETSAFRITANVNFSSMTDPILGVVDTDGNDVELDDKSSTLGITLRPGLEWHLIGNDKLSPYYGAEAIISFVSMTDKTEYNNVEVGDDGSISEGVETMTTKNSTTAFGLNGVAGFDFYFAQNIFIGSEIGFGFLLENMGDTKFEDSGDSDNNVDTPNGSTFTVAPNFVGQIRAGIIF